MLSTKAKLLTVAGGFGGLVLCALLIFFLCASMGGIIAVPFLLLYAVFLANKWRRRLRARYGAGGGSFFLMALLPSLVISAAVLWLTASGVKGDERELIVFEGAWWLLSAAAWAGCGVIVTIGVSLSMLTEQICSVIQKLGRANSEKTQQHLGGYAMKKAMIVTTVLTCAAAVVFALLYKQTAAEVFEVLMITSVTTMYHFAMRLCVGYVLNGILQNRVDHTKWWFAQRSFEQRLYKVLHVRRWKDRMPTFDPSQFDMHTQTPQQLLGVMCQAELVHEVIVVFSFVPLLFTLIWGTFPVFLLTSVAAALIDICFVIMQRYNRPRVLSLLSKRSDTQNGDVK